MTRKINYANDANQKQQCFKQGVEHPIIKINRGHRVDCLGLGREIGGDVVVQVLAVFMRA